MGTVFRKRADDVQALQLPADADGLQYDISLTITTNGTPVITTATATDWLVQDQATGVLSVMTDTAFQAAYETLPNLGSDTSTP